MYACAFTVRHESESESESESLNEKKKKKKNNDERLTVVTWMNWKEASADDDVKVESSVLVGVLCKRERRSVELES